MSTPLLYRQLQTQLSQWITLSALSLSVGTLITNEHKYLFEQIKGM
jgi:hypothetical protein